VADTLRQLLANSAMLSSGSAVGAGGPQLLRTADQLYEVLTLAHQLLPAMPDAATVVLQVGGRRSGCCCVVAIVGCPGLAAPPDMPAAALVACCT
jgi:hypothetical protein